MWEQQERCRNSVSLGQSSTPSQLIQGQRRQSLPLSLESGLISKAELQSRGGHGGDLAFTVFFFFSQMATTAEARSLELR